MTDVDSWGQSEQVQQFRLREEAIGMAVRLGGPIDTALANAERIRQYIEYGLTSDG